MVSAEPLLGETRRPPALLVAAAAATALVFVGPLAWLIGQNQVLDGEFLDYATESRTVDSLLRTLRLAAAVSIASAVIGTAMAWFLVRTDVPGRRLLRVLAPLPLVFPSYVAATALIAGWAPGGLLHELLDPLGFDGVQVRGFRGAFVALTLFTYPYVYLPVAARLTSLPPSLEESARLLGSSPFATFRRVILPQLSSAIAAGALLVALYTISEFGATRALRYDTLTVRIYENQLYDRPRAVAAALVLAIVALCVVGAERGVARWRRPTASVATRPALLVPLGRSRAAVTAGVSAVLGLALAGPVAVLTYWSIRGVVHGRGQFATDPGKLATPALHTATLGVVTAIIAVAVLLPLAYLVGRYRSRLGAAASAFVVSGFATPGLVISLALVFWVLETDAVAGLYQTLPVVVTAYVLHFGAQAATTAQVAVASVPRRLDEAARLLGANTARRVGRIDLPLMMPGLLAGMGLVLLSTMKELPATLLLAPPGYQTLATRVWSSLEAGRLAQASFASLVLVALSGVLTWALVIRRGLTSGAGPE